MSYCDMSHYTHPSVVGSFYKVGDFFYYDRGWRGQRIRVSTKQKDLESAAAWVRDTPFGSRLARKPVAVSVAFFKRMCDRARHRAKVAGLRFELTVDEVQELYERAEGHCEVSGLPFSMEEMDGVTRRPYLPSIDRINCLVGYTKENCRLVCSAVNLAMNEFGEKVLWEIASSMVLKRTKQPLNVINPAIVGR